MNRETTNHRVGRRDARHVSEAVADKGQGAMAGGIDAELMDCARQGAHPIPIALLALPESSVRCRTESSRRVVTCSSRA